ncbi:MAG: NifB/NifX family molybdenum-iron cluster-binding protein [Deltaproteobacteria bacterium]|nr:NifB/NifX family molybdenum-iron cluster-binding protein [Deltaproteobacteria bacterium]
MKVAITASGDNLDSPLDSRFGRAPKFIIYDTDTGDFKVVDNTQNLNAPQGAGLQAAQNVAKEGVNCVITGHCGPRAFSILQRAGIDVYYSNATTVKEAIEAFKEGKLDKSQSPDVEGHWV